MIPLIYVDTFNLLRWNDVPRTSRTFSPKIATFSQFQINLLLPNSEFKEKATNYCVRFGHSLRSANQLPAQVVGYTGCRFFILFRIFIKWTITNDCRFHFIRINCRLWIFAEYHIFIKWKSHVCTIVSK